MTNLILPKVDKEGVPYLSYTQYTTWKKNKRDYIRQYFFGERFTGNDYTEFGSKVGEALENNDFTQFSNMDAKFLKSVPRYDEFEREIKYQLNGFYVLGFIDTNSIDGNVTTSEVDAEDLDIKPLINSIADYKTGDIEKKTSEYQSDDYKQLDIYAGALLQETGHLPNDVKVFLIGRKGNAFKGEPLKLTREWVSITKNVTVDSVRAVEEDLQRVAEEISVYYKMFLRLKNI